MKQVIKALTDARESLNNRYQGAVDSFARDHFRKLVVQLDEALKDAAEADSKIAELEGEIGRLREFVNAFDKWNKAADDFNNGEADHEDINETWDEMIKAKSRALEEGGSP